MIESYAKGNDLWVYDPFMGSGTTAVACQRMGLNYIGSEISAAQVEYAKKRLAIEGNVSSWLDALLGGV